MQKYKINAPHVIHEVIEGEAILVNLKSGNYYSFDNSGLIIWEVLLKTGVGDLLSSTIAAVYGIDEKEVKEDIEKFVKKLIQEKLIVLDTEDTDKPKEKFLNQLINEYRSANVQYEPPFCIFMPICKICCYSILSMILMREDGHLQITVD
jgi:hypothetical protein